ncbi:MAG: hypothetical protein P8Y63_08720 [Deltaproteobacteria bacterium]
MALVLFFVMGYGPMPAWSGQPGEDTITAAEIAAARMAAADVLGGGIVFVTGNQAKAKGFARIIQGPAVLIEPHKSGPHPYTLITFQTRVHEK